MQEVQETQVQSLGQEDPLEEDMATHSSILVWRILRTEKPGRLQSMGSQSWTQSVQSLNPVRLFVTPWTVAHQASLFMGFSRQEYWSGLPWPPPGALPDPGTEPVSPVTPPLRQVLYH